MIPSDFKVTYHWAGPTVRPPLHFEYTISIDASGQGSIDYRPNYPNHNPPHWVETFAVDPGALGALGALLDKQKVFGGTFRQRAPGFVGGEQAWLEAAANGQQAEVPAGLNPQSSAKIQPVFDAVHALVPKATWDKLGAQRQEYISAQTK